jgi:hypothetical protein
MKKKGMSHAEKTWNKHHNLQKGKVTFDVRRSKKRIMKELLFFHFSHFLISFFGGGN